MKTLSACSWSTSAQQVYKRHWWRVGSDNGSKNGDVWKKVYWHINNNNSKMPKGHVKSAYCASAVVNKRGVQIEHGCHKICRVLVAYEVRQLLYWMVVCCDGDIETSRGVAVNLPVCTVTASLPFSLRRFSDPTENTLTVYHAPDLSCSICTLVFSVSLTLGTWVSVELESWMRYRWAPSK